MKIIPFNILGIRFPFVFWELNDPMGYIVLILAVVVLGIVAKVLIDKSINKRKMKNGKNNL